MPKEHRGMDQNPQETDQGLEPPRQPPRQAPLTPEIVERGTRDDSPEWGTGAPFRHRGGIGGWLFGPRSFAGGRVQVYGCSPGCLLVSLIVSVLASILLTLLLNAIF
jgi:hypothetical protein